MQNMTSGNNLHVKITRNDYTTTDPAERQQVAVSDKCAVVEMALTVVVPRAPAYIKLGQ